MDQKPVLSPLGKKEVIFCFTMLNIFMPLFVFPNPCSLERTYLKTNLATCKILFDIFSFLNRIILYTSTADSSIIKIFMFSVNGRCKFYVIFRFSVIILRCLSIIYYTLIDICTNVAIVYVVVDT